MKKLDTGLITKDINGHIEVFTEKEFKEYNTFEARLKRLINKL